MTCEKKRWSSIVFVTVVAVLGTAELLAQPRDGVIIESTRVRVAVTTAPPHHRSLPREYESDRVLVFLTDGQFTITSTAGQVERIDFKKGDVRWRPASGSSSTENVTDHAIQVVEIELRDKPMSPPPTLSKLDPLTVDPKHYMLELENERVRVLRVRFGPMEKGQLHEHTFSNVVVYLNDQARGKLGEARMDGPRTHSEENLLDRTVERVSIDLK